MVANIGISQPDYVLVRRVSDPSSGHQLKEEEGEHSPVVGSTNSREDSGSAAEGSSSEAPVRPAKSAREGGPQLAEEKNASEVTREEGGKEGRVRNGEVAGTQEKEKSTAEELLQPTLQALAVLSNVSTPCWS